LEKEPAPFQRLAASHRPFAIQGFDPAYNRRRVFDIVVAHQDRRLGQSKSVGENSPATTMAES
jgi:hypothetical protein